MVFQRSPVNSNRVTFHSHGTDTIPLKYLTDATASSGVSGPAGGSPAGMFQMHTADHRYVLIVVHGQVAGVRVQVPYTIPY